MSLTRLARLRGLLQQHRLAAYIVPSADAHQSEYVAECDLRRGYISRFDGSAGTVVVTPSQALLWTDGRYHSQAEKQLQADWTLMKQGLKDVPGIEKWLDENLKTGDRVGIDPWTTSLTSYLRYKHAFGQKLDIVPIEENLIDKVWGADRPPAPSSPLRVHTLEFSGKSCEDKLALVRTELKKANCRALIVSALDEVAWLFNLRGADIDYNPVFISYAIVTQDDCSLFVNTSKVTAEVKDHLGDSVKILPYDGYSQALADLKQLIQGQDTSNNDNNNNNNETKNDNYNHNNSKNNRVWVDPLKSNFFTFQSFDSKYLHQKQSPIALMKSLKNEVEIEGMRQAHIRDAVAMCKYLNWLEQVLDPDSDLKSPVELNEVTVANKLEEFRAEQKHFVGLSFETISSSGPNGAIIHYAPSIETALPINTTELYLFDSGGQYLDGTTDVTRTVHFGQPSSFEVQCFTRVLQGHIALSQAVFPPGTPGPKLDTLARMPLWQDGLDYLHGTGHGVGAFLNVHEGPQGISSSIRSSSVANTPFQAGMTCSNEPGYYHDGKFGIRIENVVVTKVVETENKFMNKDFLGFEQLTVVPYQKKMMNVDLLTKKEIEWINQYHEFCRQKLTPLLQDDPSTLKWLNHATEPIQ